MFFDPHVKEKGTDFFNFAVLQEELKQSLEDPHIPLIVVSGLRRTGKTSLIRVVLNSMKKKYIWIDARAILSRSDFYQTLAQETQKLKPFRISGFSIRGVELQFETKKGLDLANKKKIPLVIDEAQLLARFKLQNLIAFIYDNYPKVKIILSGSETGMLMNFMGKNNAKAPLYGRAVFELTTHRLDRESASLFLREGARQAKKHFEDAEIHQVIATLDGMIGWLTKYGWHRLRISHPQALRKTVEEGKKVVKEEFLRFAARAEGRYVSLLKYLKGGGLWEEIKNGVGMSDKQLASMLGRLIHYGFVEKEGRVYKIADPLLEMAF